MTEFEIGFIMGLVVGEGSWTGDKERGWLQIKLHENDPWPLFETRRLLGGDLYGPYHSKDGRRFYSYKLTTRELLRALPLFKERLPASRKRQQFEAWLKKYGSSLARTKASRPARLSRAGSRLVPRNATPPALEEVKEEATPYLF